MLNKKLYPLILLIIFSFACNENKLSREDIIRQNIEAKLIPQMKNPDSYEFVSLGIKRTFSVAERKKSVNQEQLEEIRELNKELPSPELLSQIEMEFAFLESQPDPLKDAVYYVDFVAKGTNSYGGIIQNKYSATVLNDENYTVVNLKSME